MKHTSLASIHVAHCEEPSHNKQCPCQVTVSRDPSLWPPWTSAWLGRDRNLPQRRTVPRAGWPAESVPRQGKCKVWQREQQFGSNSVTIFFSCYCTRKYKSGSKEQSTALGCFNVSSFKINGKFWVNLYVNLKNLGDCVLGPSREKISPSMRISKITDSVREHTLCWQLHVT